MLQKNAVTSSSLELLKAIPMKLQAVSNRNAKKDYWDIAALLKQYPLSEMLKIFHFNSFFKKPITLLLISSASNMAPK